MKKNIKNEEVNEEIVNESVEETQKASDEQTEKKETEEPRELTSEEKIAELEKQIEELKKQQLYKVAEFDNFRRRTSQEKLELVSMASTDTIKGMLPVLDDCERALKVLLESNDSDAAKEGTELIFNKLMSYLKTKGLAVIEAMNQPFDTDLHEAVAQFPVPEEDMKGKVFDVVQTGYTLNGKVIRFAKVVVGI